MNGEISAADYGVVASNADNSPALQSLADARPDGATIVLTGGLTFKSPVEFARGPVTDPGKPVAMLLRGQGKCAVTGNFDGPIFAFNQAGANITQKMRVKNIAFSNFHATGTGLHLDGCHDVIVEDCKFGPANRGLICGNIHTTNTEVRVVNCYFVGGLKRHPNSIGCAMFAQGSITGCSFIQWGEGMRLARKVTVSNARCENNGIALRTGMSQTGNPFPFMGAVTDLTSEATYSPIVVGKNTHKLILQNIAVHGTGNTITPGPLTRGIYLEAGSGPVILDNVTCSGAFPVAAIELVGAGPVCMRNVEAGIKGAAGVPWKISMDPAKLTYSQCNVP